MTGTPANKRMQPKPQPVLSHVPAIAVIAADVIVVVGYVLIARVQRKNSCASRIVEVERGQRVIASSPYAIVRHPMYVGVLVIYLLRPIARQRRAMWERPQQMYRFAE